MNIRWRLGVITIQMIILVIATSLATNKPYSGATWFAAGLLAVVINSQILEPFYSRPADVIGNAIICLLLYFTTTKNIALYFWSLFLATIILVLTLAIFASVFGTGKAKGNLAKYAKLAKTISSEATAVRIYSMVFWLSLIESYPKLEKPFWIMGISWAVTVALGLIDWQKAWAILTGTVKECTVEGVIAPSRIIINAPELPSPGSWIKLQTNELKTSGVVISRIQRMEDVWGQVYLDNQQDCESLLKSRNIAYEMFSQADEDILGIADEGSSQENLLFYPSRQLEIGNVVSIRNGETEVFYQIHTARIQKLEVKGGSLLQTQANAKQLGIFDKDTFRLKQYYWSPSPGTAVSASNLKLEIDNTKIQGAWVLIGYIVGTEIPIYLDTKMVGEGHLAILGMTKMGKTTLALKIMNVLAQKRIVTVLDQTGEYRKKRGIAAYTEAHDKGQNSIAVLEPNPDEAIVKACKYLQDITNLARTEYEHGNPKLRAVLVEEAHQFVPEPTGMDFKDDNRKSSQRFGALMMQIRKYGISTILVSQRTAVVAKSALSQCENIIAFKSVDKTGLDYLDTVAGYELSNMLPLLKQGEAVVFGPAFSCDVPVAIKVVQDPENQQQEEQLLPPVDIPPEYDDIPPEDDIPF